MTTKDRFFSVPDLSYEKNPELILGRINEINMAQDWLNSLKTNYASPLVITGLPGVGKTTLLHTIERRIKNFDNFQTVNIIATKENNILKDLFNFGKPNSFRTQVGIGFTGEGFGVNYTQNRTHYESSYVSSFLKKIGKKKKHFFIIFIDSTLDIEYDIGEEIRYIRETAQIKDIKNLNFVISISQNIFERSYYLTHNTISIKLKKFDDDTMFEYAKLYIKKMKLNLPEDVLLEHIKESENDINQFKKTISLYHMEK